MSILSRMNNTDRTSRHLPIYLLLDCSESMVGEPLEMLVQGLRGLQKDLMDKPEAVELAWISVITFSGKAKQIIPLTSIDAFLPPTLLLGPGTSLGEAFRLLGQCIKNEVRVNAGETRGDYRPIIFLVTDGLPTDDWKRGYDEFRRVIASHITSSPNIVALGCGPDVDTALLKEITPNVLSMKTISPGAMSDFFKWVSGSVGVASSHVDKGSNAASMPVPPKSLTERSLTHSSTPTQLIFLARCKRRHEYYLMRYRKGDSGKYYAEKAYPVGNDYVADVKSGTGADVDTSQLDGAPACPYCGLPGWKPSSEKGLIECNETLILGGGSAQVMFVLDRTGSMGDEIEGVKESIKDFIDYIQSEGLDVEVGLIAFRDLEEGEPPEVLRFASRVFTKDSAPFKREISRLVPEGGGNNPGESSYDAVALACQQPFSDGMEHILVLITDEPPLLPDGRVHNLNDLERVLRSAHIGQIYIIVPPVLTAAYQPLSRLVPIREIMRLGDGGRGGDSFKRILLDIGRKISIATRIG